MKVKIKKLYEDAILPSRESDSAAGYDLYAYCDPSEQEEPIAEMKPHETIKIGTGLAIEIPEGYFGAIFARSGLATKQGLRPANCVGVIDSDYRGEIIVPIHNDGIDTKHCQEISYGDRIAQLIIMPYLPVEFEEVERLSDTQRGTGGFGSTGK